jgi:hypothetical protein
VSLGRRWNHADPSRSLRLRFLPPPHGSVMITCGWCQMYNSHFLQTGRDEIERQILAMPLPPHNYGSDDYLRGFCASNPQLYRDWIGGYLTRHHTLPHAKQIVHSQLMHTVSTCFPHLTRKVQTIPNLKGGDTSLWERF